MRGLLGSAHHRARPRRLVSANFENASRIRAFGLRSYFWTRRPQLVGLPTADAGNDLVETGSAPLRRLQPAIVSTELLRYNVVLTVGADQSAPSSS